VGRIGPLAKEEFVLTPMDNLSYFLQPQIRERYGTWCYVAFRGPEMVGAFKAKKKGKDLFLYELVGGPEIKKMVVKHVRELGMTIREPDDRETPDWELMDFYERTHPGEV
jgi:hypothetical protein